MQELIEKLETLRKWKRNGIIKISKEFRQDDFDTLVNQIENYAIQALQERESDMKEHALNFVKFTDKDLLSNNPPESYEELYEKYIKSLPTPPNK